MKLLTAKEKGQSVIECENIQMNGHNSKNQREKEFIMDKGAEDSDLGLCWGLLYKQKAIVLCTSVCNMKPLVKD